MVQKTAETKYLLKGLGKRFLQWRDVLMNQAKCRATTDASGSRPADAGLMYVWSLSCAD